MQSQSNRTSPRALLFASASALALAVAVSGARAADAPIAMRVKAPPEPKGELRVFGEGGVSWWQGDPVLTFFPIASIDTFTSSSGTFALRPRVGWDVAAGFDYRFAASPWHVSGQVRYGQGRSSTGFANSFSGAGYYPGTTLNVSQATTSVDRESHWLADFAVGRDLNIGANPLQVKAGIRIAQLTSSVDTQTNGSASITGVPGLSYEALNSISNLQRSSFRGGGPRLGFEGAVPLGSLGNLITLRMRHCCSACAGSITRSRTRQR